MITPNSESSHQHLLEIYQEKKLASLEATLVQDYYPASDSLTWVMCRATSGAKKKIARQKNVWFECKNPFTYYEMF